MALQRKILVMIPTYNEGKTITSVINHVKEALPLADILVIDGGSDDETCEKAKDSGAFVLTLPYSMGIGGAIETGFKFAAEMHYDILARVDGDGQHNPDELPGMIKLIEKKEADVIIGSRFFENKNYKNSFFRVVAINIFSFVDSLLIGQRVTDPTSGFQVYNSKIIEFFGKKHVLDYSEVEFLFLLDRIGFKTKEVPVSMRIRSQGSSSFNSIRSFVYVFRGILALFVGLFQNFPQTERKTDDP